ncbi:GNAT family N-acetyltransferase [Paenibacillus sp. PAMC 26794]|uniref:GNAT family N-acetyltransferase n=1 Tax=Paenibacillus sp. PAMC 26794 TaxID=1257080 RepID=UPI0003827C5F|nr:GNAT family N-acetyltransferase [Paenibacillus sp. PAMC 26794]
MGSRVDQWGSKIKSEVIWEDLYNEGREYPHICGEVTVYLKPDILGKGLGKQALRFIEKIAKEQGFHTLIATICMENTRSKSLFERNGYEQCALFKEIGYKFDRKLDIGSFQKIL